MAVANILKASLVVSCVVLILFFIMSFTQFTRDQERFEKFIKKYNKSYVNGTEHSIRFKQFKESLKTIKLLRQSCNGCTNYGITEFSDLSPDEFTKIYLNSNTLRIPQTGTFSMTRSRRSITTATLPSIDWREKKVVTPVRNQKNCGACWAISVIELIESVYAIKTGSLQTFSVQEMLDCSGGINQGCIGGSSVFLLLWLVENNITIFKEENYPTVYKNQICTFNKTFDKGIKVKSFLTLNLMDREDLLLSYLSKSPVSVALNALPWQFYVGGVLSQCDNSMTSLNHAAQIVGYKLGENPYYILKNSWGTNFGNDGYIYVAIGNNECGIGWEVDVVTNVV
ncbi:cathepsin O-like [Rhopalosiphum maidis]|uniref:cathepsin O-like n=1 Tax=Rhopalosiphum maidis TaxID=43146 RepID=UPI000EFF4058|nr:cathepsin O-like [Rhopalosiphum maidis]